MPSASKPTLLVAGLASVVLAVEGCARSSDSGVAHLYSGRDSSPASSEGRATSSQIGKPGQQLVAFAKCMRSHSVSSFPEPAEGHLLASGSSINVNSAQFQVAHKQCRALLPNGGEPSAQVQKQEEERGLRFAACMRTHGEPSLPNPETVGADAVRLGHVDLNSPQFKAAAKACLQYFPGGPKGEPSG